jgi:hypothetical protein
MHPLTTGLARQAFSIASYRSLPMRLRIAHRVQPALGRLGIGCVVIDLAQPMIRFVTHQIQFVSWTIERRLAIMRTTLREMTRENLTKT